MKPLQYPAPELTHPISKMAYRMVRFISKEKRWPSDAETIKEINKAAELIKGYVNKREAWIFKKLAMEFING